MITQVEVEHSMAIERLNETITHSTWHMAGMCNKILQSLKKFQCHTRLCCETILLPVVGQN